MEIKVFIIRLLLAMVAGVVIGIGFLGAGVILHQGINIQGLTTAATIWCSSGIGCLAAAGYYAEVAVSVVAVVLVNVLFRLLDDWIRKPDNHE
ncbi:MAG: MgtC/SapB family protein [Bacteroidia bacterium]|nr:MgtC/SapB family protein [Bacteroidia bacterium]